MIDEKFLESVKEVSSKEEWHELIRLARLGLWAEKHGIPALGYYTEVYPEWNSPHYCKRAKEALARVAELEGK